MRQGNIIGTESGVATLIALIMVGMLALIGIAAISMSGDEASIAGNELQEMRAFYAAEAGLEQAAADLQHLYDTATGGIPYGYSSTFSDSVNYCAVACSTLSSGAPTSGLLTAGTLAGLNAMIQTYSVSSEATNAIERSRIQLSQDFEVALVPIFQFAVFYGNDLEIAPGPDMSLIGRVHSNGDMWLQSGSNLYMSSFVTASGSIYHGRKGAGGVDNGNVFITNADGDSVSMRQNGTWFDASHDDWYDSSVSFWQGRVQDQAHGQGELNVPLTGASDDPHKLIERSDGNPDSYENKATVKIVDGSVIRLNKYGVWEDVTADMISDGVITYTPNKFYDGREGEWVDCTEIDVGALYSHKDGAGDYKYAPVNGVVYFADDISGGSEWPGLRLANGAEIEDSQGLTVVSENPLYTVGDYNTVDKKPASLMGDAITFLSNAWDSYNYDSSSTQHCSNRVASSTTVNASYLTGNTETTSSNYNGGFENLPRFLEKWSGKNFNWSGSAVNLWYSSQATAPWVYGSYYQAPNRNWSYDTDLDDPTKLPPETPCVRVFQRVGWKQNYVSFDS